MIVSDGVNEVIAESNVFTLNNSRAPVVVDGIALDRIAADKSKLRALEEEIKKVKASLQNRKEKLIALNK